VPSSTKSSNPETYEWTMVGNPKTVINPRMFDTIDLPNGLKVEFYDYSRRVAGDRWLVGLLVRVPIRVSREDFSSFSDPDGLFERFVSENGEVLSFELQKERNFIDEREKDKVFSRLLANLKKHALAYMGHREFAAGFKRKKIAEFKERLSWWQ